MNLVRNSVLFGLLSALLIAPGAAAAQQRCAAPSGSNAEWAAVASGQAQPPVKSIPRLAYALGKGQQRRALLKRLLAQGDDPNVCVAGASLLSLSALSDDVEEVRLLLDAGAHLDSPLDSGGGTPLLAALGMRRYETAALLVERGADMMRKNDVGASALHELAVAGDPSDPEAARNQMHLAAMLVAKGHSIDPRNIHGTTPLLYATIAGNLGLATWLVEHGADPNARNAKGDTPLAAARRRNKEAFVELFERAGAPPKSGEAATPSGASR